MSHTTRLLVTAAAFAAPMLAAPSLVSAQDNRPVVVVFAFGNNSFGTAKADFDGVGTAVQDLLITDLASNPKYRIVDRTSIDAVLKEQGMVRSKEVDPATAVRLGKIFGAQYAIIGGFMSDGHGAAVLTGRTVDMETTQIANPEKITGKSDNVLGIINELSAKLGSNMKLESKAGTRRVGDAGEVTKSAPVQSGSPAASSPAAQAVQYAKPVSQKALNTKLDVATMKIYSNGLDAMDEKNNTKAAQLFQQVHDKFPDFEPATTNLNKVKSRASN